MNCSIIFKFFNNLGSGKGGEAVCGDGSDQKHCTHTVYSGKFISTDMGRRQDFTVNNFTYNVHMSLAASMGT